MFRIPARLTIRRSLILLLSLLSLLLISVINVTIPSFSLLTYTSQLASTNLQDVLVLHYQAEPVYEYTSFYRNNSDKDLEAVLDKKLLQLEHSVLEKLASNKRDDRVGGKKENETRSKNREAKKTIHQPYTPKQSAEYSTWLAQWQLINPSWETNHILLPPSTTHARELEIFKVFVEHLPELAALYDAFEPVREDLLRWMMLWFYGGLYVEHDTWDRIGVERCEPLLPLLVEDGEVERFERGARNERRGVQGGKEGEVGDGNVQAESHAEPGPESEPQPQLEEESQQEPQRVPIKRREDISLVLGIETDEPFLDPSGLQAFRLTRGFGFSKAIIWAPKRFDPFLRHAIVRTVSHSLVHLRGGRISAGGDVEGDVVASVLEKAATIRKHIGEIEQDKEEISGKHMLTDIILDVLSETLPPRHELRDWKAGLERRVTWKAFTWLIDPVWIPGGHAYEKSDGDGARDMDLDMLKRNEQMRGLLVLPVKTWGSGQNHSRAGGMDDVGACVNHAPGLRPPG